jgi:long-chain acyl-CoA synthetase
MMVGYYKDPEHSAEAIDAEGWLHTGDMGKLDREGYLTITGRMKDVFKTAKGKYVAPVPIEGMLGQEPIIEQLCVIGYGMPQPVALVQLAESAMKGDKPGWKPSWRPPSTGSTTSWNPMLACGASWWSRAPGTSRTGC